MNRPVFKPVHSRDRPLRQISDCCWRDISDLRCGGEKSEIWRLGDRG